MGTSSSAELTARHAPRYRLYRASIDGSRTVFSTAQDAQIPVIDGVTIMCRDRADVDEIQRYAAMTVDRTTKVRKAWNGRPEVVVVQSQTRAIDVCHGCGDQVEHDADGPCCAGEVVQIEAMRASALMGTTRRASAGSDADLRRLGLRRAS